MQYLGTQPVQGISRTKNLFPQHFYIGKTSNSNGVTAEGLSNGLIRIKGTSTARPQIAFFYRWDYYLPAGTYSAINPNIDTGCNIAYGFSFADGTTKTMYCTKSNKITLEQDTVKLSLFFYGFNDGVEHTYNYTCPIMLVEFDGYYSGEYQPYLQRYDMYMYDNLIKMPYSDGLSKTVNGITFTVDEETGWVTANGTATSIADFNLAKTHTLTIPTKCVVKGCPNGGSSTTYQIQIYRNADAGETQHKTFSSWGENQNEVNTWGEFIAQFVRIRIRSGMTVNNLVFKPELIKLIGD